MGRFILAVFFLYFCLPLNAGTESGTLIGIVLFKGTPSKRPPVDLSKESACVKMHASNPLLEDTVVTGRGNGLANVVVYISAGETDRISPQPNSAAIFEQQGCRYKTHVLAVRLGQDINVVNNDPISHDIHPVAKLNREWSRIQPPGTPPFSYSYEKEEIIPVKCNIHPWMHAYFVVLNTRHFAVTAEDGVFRLPDLRPGQYTVTAWHESLGTQTQEVVVTSGQNVSIYFTFPAQP